jgi:hypothetical protein
MVSTLTQNITRLIAVLFVVLLWVGGALYGQATRPNWTFTRTSLSSVIAIPLEVEPSVDGVPLVNGDYIGVFYDSLGTLACAGYVMWDGEENVGLTAYGDDVQLTPDLKEGFAANEPYKWKVWRRSDNQEFDMQVEFDAQTFPGQRVFNNNTFAVLARLVEKQIDIRPPWFVEATTDSHMVDFPINVGPSFANEALQPGDYIGAFYDSTSTDLACAGILRWEGISTTMTVYGNTNGTQKNGFSLDEVFKWKLWRARDQQEFEAEAIYDLDNYVQDSLYFSDGLSGIRQIFAKSAPVEGEGELELDKLVRFDEVNITGSWRLISLPGADTTFNVDDLMVGQHNKIWTAFHFDGERDFVQYNQGIRDDFFFKPGNGFLVLSNDVFVIRDTFVPRVTMNVDSTFSVPLSSGWNLISNPYQYLVDWEKTRDFNRLRGNNSVIYQFISGSYRKPRIIEPYKAYFFYNVDNLPNLKIPHPGKFIPPSDFNFFKATEADLLLHIEQEDGRSAIPLEVFLQNEGASELHIPHPPSLSSDFRAGWSMHPQDERLLVSTSVDQPTSDDALPLWHLRVEMPEAGQVKLRPDFLVEGAVLLVENAAGYREVLRAGELLPLNLAKGAHVFTVQMGTEAEVQQLLSDLPTEVELAQNYPNPFNPSTTIRFSLQTPQNIQLAVYDLTGRRVATLANGYFRSGVHQVQMDASRLSSGVYIYRLQTETGQQLTRKMTLIR